ncbi:purine permease [Tissierella creatinini]|nr:purine permease [Tissierella creatinini]TJX65581.1 purine permease [Soehngenia saccharolytica]
MKKEATANKSLFSLYGQPGFKKAFPQSLQHVLAMLVGNITPPILIANATGLSPEEKVMLVQAAMLIGGIVTLIQLFSFWGFGVGLPNVMGVAFAYMPVLLAIGKQYGVDAVFGAQIIGAFVSIFVGMFIGKIRKYFPPIVSGTVVLTIGLSLYSTGLNYMAGGVGTPDFGSYRNWIVAIITLLVVLLCNMFGKGYLKISAMLIGILAGYGISGGMGMVSFTNVGDSSWISLPKLFYWGLEFPPSAVVSMIVMYIVNAVQSIGDFSSTAIGAFGREATDKELGGAIKGNGLGGMIGALFGGLPTDPYSQNVGLIVTTKVVSLKVFKIVAIVMLLAGFFPKLGAVMTTIPYPVLGGATMMVFASITMSGMELINQQESTHRNKTIVGLAIALGMGVTMVPNSIANFPDWFKMMFGSSPIIIAFFVAFVLNAIIPDKSLEEEAELIGMEK